MKSQQAEAKKLVSKWEKTGLLDGLNEDFKKSGMAVMLENQAKQLINEFTGTGGRAAGSTAGAGESTPPANKFNITHDYDDHPIIEKLQTCLADNLNSEPTNSHII